jgi:hypothetical protein
MLYAVGVGAGLDDPTRDLHLTTENTAGQPLEVLPTFLTQMDGPGKWSQLLGWGDDQYGIAAVHAGQSVTLARPIPTRGTATIINSLDGIYDKGAGALLVVGKRVVLEDTGELLGQGDSIIFVPGKGGFGGPRNPPAQADMSDTAAHEADMVVSLPIGLNQSLIYRLLGDRNPHTTDPEQARADGFERPAFFGRGTLGVVCRALVRGLCDSDPARMGHVEGRFSNPVYPGDRLDTLIWKTADGAHFQVRANDERVVFDRGVFRFALAG